MNKKHNQIASRISLSIGRVYIFPRRISLFNKAILWQIEKYFFYIILIHLMFA